MTTPFCFFPLFNLVLPTIVFATTDDSITNNTTYNFTGLISGSPNPVRSIIIAASGIASSGSRSISSVVFDGVACNIAVTTTGYRQASSISIVQAPGTITGNLSITFSASMSRCLVGIWAAYDLKSITPVGTGSVTAGASTSLNTTAGGIIVAALSSQNPGTSVWTGAGLTQDARQAGENNTHLTIASAMNTPAGSPTAVSVTNPGTDAALAVAAFR